MIMEGCLVYFNFSYQATHTQELEVSLPNDLLNKYGNDDQITAAVNFMQRDVSLNPRSWTESVVMFQGKCCGSNAFNDWPKPEVVDHYLPYVKEGPPQRVQYVPDSCCKATHQRKGCALSDSPNNIFYKVSQGWREASSVHNLCSKPELTRRFSGMPAVFERRSLHQPQLPAGCHIGLPVPPRPQPHVRLLCMLQKWRRRWWWSVQRLRSGNALVRLNSLI